jgi:VWFA-related protein
LGLRTFLVALAAAAAIVAAAGAQQAPRFTGGVDLIQIDVAVLDAQRRPVAGLTAADFTVLEDGKPQPIVAFQEMSAPDPDGSLVPWMREVAPDVRTNSADGRRVFVIVIDDASIGDSLESLRALDNMKKIARAFVERMGPLDQAAIVQTGDNSHAQEFTGERAALLRVIDRVHLMAIPFGLGAIYSPTTVMKVAESLIAVSHRRKALVYIGSGLRLSVENTFAQVGTPDPLGGAQGQASHIVRNAIERAQRAHVSIYTINPRGLEVDVDIAAATARNAIDDTLHAVSNATGGFAVTNTNSFSSQVGQIFRETGSYYLLGFQSAYTDGKFRRISVTVNRPGATVRTRNGYYAPDSTKTDKNPSAPLFKAMAGVLPNPDIYMRASVAPFAVRDRKSGKPDGGGVAIVLGLTQPAPADQRVSHVMDLVATAFTREGKAVAHRRQTARLTMRPSEAGEARFEILTRLDLKPGLYNLRFAVHNAALGKSGSVYSEVEVPNFEKNAVSLSGVAVSVAPGLAAAGKDLLADLLPVVPTTQRSFAAADRVSAFLRVYQGGKKAFVPIAMRVTIRDERDAVAFRATESLAPERFGAARDTDYRLDVPTATLPPGPYLLTIEAGAGEKPAARREVRFNIR